MDATFMSLRAGPPDRGWRYQGHRVHQGRRVPRAGVRPGGAAGCVPRRCGRPGSGARRRRHLAARCWRCLLCGRYHGWRGQGSSPH